jgi:hypothetical protein
MLRGKQKGEPHEIVDAREIETEYREKEEGKRRKISKKKRGKEDEEKPKTPKQVWGIFRGLRRYFKVAPDPFIKVPPLAFQWLLCNVRRERGPKREREGERGRERGRER